MSLAQTDKSKHRPPRNTEDKRQYIKSRKFESAFSPASYQNKSDMSLTSQSDRFRFWFPFPHYMAATDNKLSDSERRRKYSCRQSISAITSNSADHLFRRKHIATRPSLLPESYPATSWSWWSPAIESERVWESSLAAYKRNRSTSYDHSSWKAHVWTLFLG